MSTQTVTCLVKYLKRKTDNNSSAATTGMKRIANPKLEIKQEYVDNASNDKAAVSAETLAVSAKVKLHLLRLQALLLRLE